MSTSGFRNHDPGYDTLGIQRSLLKTLEMDQFLKLVDSGVADDLRRLKFLSRTAINNAVRASQQSEISPADVPLRVVQFPASRYINGSVFGLLWGAPGEFVHDIESGHNWSSERPSWPVCADLTDGSDIIPVPANRRPDLDPASLLLIASLGWEKKAMAAETLPNLHPCLSTVDPRRLIPLEIAQSARFREPVGIKLAVSHSRLVKAPLWGRMVDTSS